MTSNTPKNNPEIKSSMLRIILKLGLVASLSFFIALFVLEKMGFKNPNISNTSYVQAMWNGDVPITPTVTGAYLSSRAAQHRNDWAQAAEFLSQAMMLAEQKMKAPQAKDGAQTAALEAQMLSSDGEGQKIADTEGHDKQKSDLSHAEIQGENASKLNELRQRILIFNLGAGRFEEALTQAKYLEQNDLSDKELENSLGIAQAVLMVDAFKRIDLTAIEENMPKFSKGLVAQSLRPLFDSWHRVAIAKKAQDSGDKTKQDLNIGALLPLHAIYALEFSGDIGAVKKAYERLRRRADNAATKLSQASFLARNDDVEAAKKIADDLVKEFPNDEEILAFRQDIENPSSLKKNETYQTLSIHMKSVNHALAVSLYDIAINHLANRNQETALLLGKMAYALVQDLPRVNFMLSDILIERENYEEALSVLENIDETQNIHNEAVISRGEIYVKQGQQEKAFDVYEQALEKNFDPSVAIHLADLYRVNEQYQKSLEVYRDTIEYYNGNVPDNLWSIYYYKGVVHHELDQWQQAEEQLLKAKELRPNNPYVLNFLGYSWVDMNINVEEALEILHKAHKNKPDSGFITDSVGWAYYKLGNYERATEFLEEAVELMPYDPEVVDHLGDVYWQTGRKLEAYYQWKRVIDYADAEDKHHKKIVESARKKMETGL